MITEPWKLTGRNKENAIFSETMPNDKVVEAIDVLLDYCMDEAVQSFTIAHFATATRQWEAKTIHEVYTTLGVDYEKQITVNP